MDHRPCRPTICRLPSQPPTAMPHVWLRASRRGHSGLRASPDRAVAPAEHRPSRRSVVRSSNRRVRSWFLPPIVAKKLVEIRVRYYAGKTIKLSLLGDFGCRLDEGMHGDTRQRAAHADAPYAHLGKIFDREAERAAIEKIDRFGGDRLDGRFDLLAGLDAGRIKAIGAGVSEGLEPADGLVHVRPAADEALGAGSEHDIATGFVDRRARGLYARKRHVEIVQRPGGIAGRILDRQSGQAGRNATRHVLGHALGVVGKYPYAEGRLPESLHFAESDVILGVVRARSVHKIGYGHNRSEENTSELQARQYLVCRLLLE